MMGHNPRLRNRPATVMAIMAVMVLAPVMATPGCGVKKAATTEGGIFHGALTAEPVSLDPANLQDSESVRISKQIYDGLTDNDPETMKTVAAMAESWSANPDASVWTFKLRQGVMFHSGRECDAHDFVYAWNRVAGLKTTDEVARHLAPIQGFDEVRNGTATEMAGVKAIDDYALEVTLSYPCSQFPTILTHPVFSPVPREDVEAYGDEYFSEHPVGTGPFSFVSWDHEKEIVIERFAGYYGADKAHLDQIVFKIFVNEEAAYQDFKAGMVNEAQIPTSQFDAARVEYGDRALFQPMLGFSYLAMSMSSEPSMSNKYLRQALNYAVDRATLCKTVLQGNFGPATGIIPDGLYGYRDNAMPYKYDPARARDLMSKAYPAGITAPAELALGYSAGAGNDRIARSVQADFKEVGADFAIEGFEWGTYLDMIRTGQITFFYMEWSSDCPTMDSFLYPLFFSRSTDNMTSYNNPEVDRLIMEARRTADSNKSVELYRQAERLILEDSPLIPLMFFKTSRVISEDVGGYIRTALDDTPYELVYLEKSD